MTHEMRLNTQPFKKIKEGEKTIELRLYCHIFLWTLFQCKIGSFD